MGFIRYTKEERADIARGTIHICESGKYNYRGNEVDIGREIGISNSNTRFILGSTLKRGVSEDNMKTGQLLIQDLDTLSACGKLMDDMDDGVIKPGRVGALNFASAKKPGGGFIWGAMAQEESIAYCSSLYSSLVTKQKEYYDYNNKHLNHARYNDI